MEKKLLELTPLYLQKTDSILNTLLFMCLDQGHDFHDGSARTKTNDGKPTWVDLDFNGKGYLNKIPQDTFNNILNEENGKISISSENIFGKYDFIKGLLNTTFSGGNGTYGLVVVDDKENTKLGDNPTEKIKNAITDYININIELSNQYYYIYSNNDCKSEHGITIKVPADMVVDVDDVVKDKKRGREEDDDPDNNPNSKKQNVMKKTGILGGYKDNDSMDIINEDPFMQNQSTPDATILFLPFYQRVYNGDMHKLWTFNTKKHIYLIKLNKLNVNNEGGKYRVDKKEFLCEKFTTIDLIVPEYFLNFEGFLTTQLNPLVNKAKKKISDKDIENFIYNEKNKEIVYEEFAKSLFTGSTKGYNKDNDTEDDTEDDTDNDLNVFKIKDEFLDEYINNIPRGTKYHFANCQKPYFNFFLRELYKRQKPLINPVYYTNEKLKNKYNEINERLTDNNNKLLKDYIEIKLGSRSVSENDPPFISKQYGYITDTNIGSNKAQSTADKLIDSFNDTKDKNCSTEEKNNYLIDIVYDNNSSNSNSNINNISDNTNYNNSSSNDYNNSSSNINNIHYHGAAQSDLESLRKDGIRGGNEDNDSMNIVDNNSSLNTNNAYIDEATMSELQFLEKAVGLDALKELLGILKSSISIKLKQKQIKEEIKEKIKDLPNCKNIETQFKKYLETQGILIETPICGHEEGLAKRRRIDEQESTKIQLTNKPSVGLLEFKKISSQPVTTAETISDTEVSKELIEKEPFFNNIDNVNNIFDLTLNKDVLSVEPTTNINSKSMKKPMSEYIKEYSNELQLYYDFKDQINNDGTIENYNNYFNNCWISSDFYEQSGGSDYPFKFTIASGSLDSSALGGQSIPQYHPPEVDVYMPIFELGPSSRLMGIIVRMVIVKKVQSNPINSKSQVVVFCHFVYVDFERTGITPPTDISDYPDKISQLLNFAIENTVYIKEDASCVDIDQLSNLKTNLKTNLNNDNEIDFKLNFGNNVSRKWYKYFTYTQGPTVKNSIVIPTSYFTIEALKFKVSSDYVAEGIVNVAELLISNSEKLRKIFTGEQDNDEQGKQGKLLFIKLFLIRNKYTGDKSRSTDTLFLNQTKYLEGVQISNDENTLYNSQMFGLNTVWSTSSKSIFYMAPYMTPSEKLPISGGIYINELCKGLKSNPKNKATSYTGETSTANDDNDEKEFIDEFNQEILSKVDEKFTKSTDFIGYFSPLMSSTLIEYWSQGVYKLEELYQTLEKHKDYSFDSELEQKVDDYLDGTEVTKSFSKQIRLDNGDLTRYLNTISNDIKKNYDKFNEIIESIKEIKKNLYNKIIYLANYLNDTNKNKNKYDIKNFYYFENMILFLSKTFPWWIDDILYNIEIDYNENMCSNYIKIFDKLNKLLISTPNNSVKPECNIFYVYKYILSLTKEDLSKKCLSIKDPNSINPIYSIIEKKANKATRRNPIDIEKKAKKATRRNPKEDYITDPSMYLYSANIKDTDTQCISVKAKKIKDIIITPNKSLEKKIYIKEIDSESISNLPQDEQINMLELNDKKFIKARNDFLYKVVENIQNNQQPTDVQVFLNSFKNEIIDIENSSYINLPPENNIDYRRRAIQSEKKTSDNNEVEADSGDQEEADFGGGKIIGGRDISVDSRLQIGNILQEKINGTKNNLQQEKYNFLKQPDKPDFSEKTNGNAGKVKEDVAINIKTEQVTNQNLSKFYEESYKCNVGNYLKSFITIIKEIDEKYTDLSISYGEETKEIIIKILLRNIKLINKSFIPEITTNNIITILENIKNTYSISELNSIYNIYSSQLDSYMNINGIINTQYYTTEQLLNLLNDSISDYEYSQLNIPIPKPLLKQLIINEKRPSELDELEENIEDLTEGKEEVTDVEKGEEILSEVSGGNIIKVNNFSNKKTKFIKKTHLPKRTKNNKKKKNKRTLKKNHMKVKRNTRKHK
jgi:hypothetical protein